MRGLASVRQARSGVPICTSNTPTHQHTPISEKDGSFLSPDPWCVLVCGNPTSCCGRVRLVNAWESRPSRGQRATFVVGIAQRALAHCAYQPLHALLGATPVGCKAMHPCTTHTFTAAACPTTAHDCTPGARTTQPRRDRLIKPQPFIRRSQGCRDNVRTRAPASSTRSGRD